jgi:hypothetical protein
VSVLGSTLPDPDRAVAAQLSIALVRSPDMRTGIGLALAATCAVVAVPANAEVTPPANSGCGENGPTMSSERPTVTLPSTIWFRRSTGRVRIHVRDGNQVAAAAVRIRQRGGRLVGGNTNHSYTCIDRRPAAIIALPLDDYGRTLIRRNARLRVTLTFRIINGSGVRNTISRSAVIRHERKR